MVGIFGVVSGAGTRLCNLGREGLDTWSGGGGVGNDEEEVCGGGKKG